MCTLYSKAKAVSVNNFDTFTCCSYRSVHTKKKNVVVSFVCTHTCVTFLCVCVGRLNWCEFEIVGIKQITRYLYANWIFIQILITYILLRDTVWCRHKNKSIIHTFQMMRTYVYSNEEFKRMIPLDVELLLLLFFAWIFFFLETNQLKWNNHRCAALT